MKGPSSSRYLEEREARREQRRKEGVDPYPVQFPPRLIVMGNDGARYYLFECHHAITEDTIRNAREADDAIYIGALIDRHRARYRQDGAANGHAGLCLCVPDGWMSEKVGHRG